MTTPTDLERLAALEKENKALKDRIEKIEKVLSAIGCAFGSGGGSEAATDRELDAQYGNPEVKSNPRDWQGESMKGRKMSLCPPDFLDMFAETADYFAERNDAKGEKDARGNPKSYWDKKNARLARGWARRIRSGWAPPEQPANPFGNGRPATPPAFGSGRTFGSGGGFGTRKAEPKTEERPISKAEPADETSDSGTDFPFGHNANDGAHTDEDDDFPPLAMGK